MTYLDRVAALGCLICGQPAQIHHCRSGSMGQVAGMGQKSPDDLAIPLCLRHHTGSDGIHTIGVETWEARYAPQRLFLREVWRLIGEPSPSVTRKRQKRSSKILDRRFS